MMTRRLVYIIVAILAFTLNCFYVADLHQSIKHLKTECSDKK